MLKRIFQSVLCFALLFISISTVSFKRGFNSYIQQSINPDLSNWPQEEGNWCGPTALQAAIDWVWYRYNGTHRMYQQQELWDLMKNNTCYDLNPSGRDAALPGTVGDGNYDVRKMNIAYDFGVDPHAMTWTMWYLTPGGFNYHYWIYSNVDLATRYLLWTVEKYQEPTFAAVLHGFHWVLVIGYDSDYPAYPNSPGIIHRVRYDDPTQTASIWKYYNTGPDQWVNYFTSYTTNPADPDPATGWYIPPPDHWRNHWVTIERDDALTTNADHGMPDTPQKLTYLPDLKSNLDGWSSVIVIRNISSSNANFSITYYDSTGRPVFTAPSTVLNGNGLAYVYYPGDFNGSAQVAASQNISVVVINSSLGKTDAYEGVPAEASVNGIGAGTIQFVPAYFQNYYGWNSTLYIQNTGSTATGATAYYYNNSGVQVDSKPVNLTSNGQGLVNNLTGAMSGSVKVVSSSQPIAVTVRHDYTGGDSMEYDGVLSGGIVGYETSLMKNYYTWTSAYQAQEITNSSVNGSITYSSGPIRNFSLNPRGRNEIYLGNESLLGNGWLGSAILRRTSGSGQFVTAVHHSTDLMNGAIGYLGYKAGARDWVLPYVRKNFDGWDASVTVQNMDTVNAQVTVTDYAPNGNLESSYGPFTINAGATRLLYYELPTGFEGSLRLHSDGANINAVVHQTGINGTAYGYGVVK